MMRLGFVALVVAVIGGAYLGLLFLTQRSLLFPIPDRTPDLAKTGAELVRLVTDSGEVPALMLPARGASAPTPVIIFMHGNGELAADWVPVFDEVPDWGVSVLLVEYPGYGGAAGAPSEASIRRAVHAAYDWAAADPRVDRGKIVAYGRSLGGGAAARLAADSPVAALILESPFTSVADFAGRLLAPRFMVRDRFDNRAALAWYRGPLLVIHGTRDTIVPIAHGRELASIVPGARLHEIPCGHNDCDRQWVAIKQFLEHAGIWHPTTRRQGM
jgi:pimeloyl-ACP methyl ester carboxylesterase